MPRDTRINRPPRKPRYGLIAAVSTFAIAASAAGILVFGPGGSSASPAQSVTPAASAVAAQASPILPAGPARAGSIEVASPTLDLGKQPLNVTIQPTFELKNVGPDPTTLGEATIEVLEGCCPQKPIMGSLGIQPGSTTTVAVPMMMHKGMDGPHLFHVTVPVLGAGAGPQGDALHLYVRADFG